MPKDARYVILNINDLHAPEVFTIKVSLFTLGCKVNKYETQAIGEELLRNGFELALPGEKADIFIVNSCTVTAESDRKTRQAVRRFKRMNPDGCVVLTGCFPQAFPGKAKELVQADIVIGNGNNSQIVSKLNAYFNSGSHIFDVREHMSGDTFDVMNISAFNERTRAFVKIEDGCNRFCSYCIIPYARGRVRSKPLPEIEKELAVLAKNKYREIVLVGINLSAYGTDIGCNLCDAVSLACSFDGIERVRLGSLEPDHMTDEMINSLKSCEKLCPQFHISLQSGCDATLKRMNRHYTADEYFTLCSTLRQSFDDCTLTTDMMVGFPGESDSDFEESLAFAKLVGFEKIHVFPYSPRPGTKAAEFKPQVSAQKKDEREHRLLDTAAEIRERFLLSQVGKTVSVLLESKEKDGFISGFTANYTPVCVPADESFCGRTVEVKITAALKDSCTGVIQQSF